MIRHRIVIVMMLIAAAPAFAAEFAMTTHVYKQVGDVSIHADVYRHADAKARPVLVWIHGGALINGSRANPPRRLRDLCEQEGYVLVSIDYRLAPEVKLPAIIEDLKDAIAWIAERGPQLFHADTSRIVISGGSAGGYLTMMSGIAVEPRPTALVAYWGYGDVDGKWYTTPSEFYRTSMPLIGEKEAHENVYQGVITATTRENNRGLFYRYLRQNGLWTKVVTGFDPQSQRDQITPYCPVRNITPQYPPILMIHGTEDTDVPYSLSADMAHELKKHGVSHELFTVRGAGHGLSRGEPTLVNAAHDRAAEFIREHLK